MLYKKMFKRVAKMLIADDVKRKIAAFMEE